jgi:hypothetical protein
MQPMSRLAEDLTSIEGHVVQFYDDDRELASAVVRFAGAGLELGEGVLVVATPAHRAAFERALREEGHDLHGYVALDAAAMLGRLLGPDGRVDPSRFFTIVGDAIAGAADHAGGHVRVFGEMVALLCAAGDAAEAMALEALWNELAAGEQRFTLLCAYPTPSLEDPTSASLYYDACTHHSAVVGHPEAPLEAWRRFESGPSAIHRARVFTGTTLRRWGFPEVVDDALLVVSELATNAVLHARSAFHVSIGIAGQGVRVAVHDESPVAPAPRGYSTTSATGRGLRMVDAVSSRWGTVPLANRKSVWAELDERLRP